MRAASSNNLIEAMRRSVECFGRERVTYALIGAWAIAVWGRPRATTDVDFLVMVDEKDFEHLARKLALAGMEVDEVWRQWNPMLRAIQVRLRFHGVTVDVLRPRDAHDLQALKRRVKKRMEGRYYWVVAPEDLILQKLKVGRPRDFEDALSVLERSARLLNHAYLRRWARRLRVLEELDYIFAV